MLYTFFVLTPPAITFTSVYVPQRESFGRKIHDDKQQWVPDWKNECCHFAKCICYKITYKEHFFSLRFCKSLSEMFIVLNCDLLSLIFLNIAFAPHIHIHSFIFFLFERVVESKRTSGRKSHIFYSNSTLLRREEVHLLKSSPIHQVSVFGRCSPRHTPELLLSAEQQVH